MKKKKTHIMEDGKFHQYAVVFNGTISKIFIDGKRPFGKNKNFTIEFWLKGKNKKVT